MFGSAAYIHIPKDERGKLDPKAKKCVLLGYGNVRKGYRVYDHSSRKVVYSRNVKFDEREAAGPLVEEEEPAQQPLILDSGSEAESDNERGIDEEVNDDADPPAAEPPPRRSTGERRPVDYYGLPQAHLTIHREPTTFNEATACPERVKWEGTMGREMQSLKGNEVWELTSLPPGKGAIGCKWVYKVKTNSDGSLERYKARLVARGFDQRYGLDYDETFCPVVRLESLRTLIALSTQQGLELHHVDVHTAFLNGTLQEEEAAHWLRERGEGAPGVQIEEKHLRTETVLQVLEHSSRLSPQENGILSIEIRPLHLRLRRRRHLLHRSIRGRHDSGWEGQKQDEGRTVVKVPHQGPRQTGLLPGHVHCPEPGGKGDLDGATHIHSETPDQDRDERQQTCQDPSGSWTPTRESERGRGSSRSAVIPVSGRKSDVSSHVYETRHCLCCGNVGKVLQQAQPKSLDCCETCVALPEGHRQLWNSLQR